MTGIIDTRCQCVGRRNAAAPHSTHCDQFAPIPAPPADRVPTRRVAGCEYCHRYGRACGRHESTETREMSSTIVVRCEELNVSPCPYCRAYLTTGLERTAHPHHLSSCPLHPNQAWPGYVVVKLDRCNHKVDYHAERHTCLQFRSKKP